MSDTAPDIEAMVRRRYPAMAPAERLLIASQMFDTARAIILASFPSGRTDVEVRRRLCARVYGSLAQHAYPRAGEGPGSDTPPQR